jgi:hypothetical protein
MPIMPRRGSGAPVLVALSRCASSGGYRDDVARAGFLVSGVATAVLGGALLAGGAVVGLAFGPDGTVSTAPATADAAGVALLVDDLKVDAAGLPVPEGVGVLTLSARSATGEPVFLGAAQGTDLDTYLAGAPYDVVADLRPGAPATLRPVPGTQQPPPPSTQQFWLLQDEGAPAELAARIPAGTTVVVMNADATPGLAVDLSVTLEVDRAWPAALAFAGAGLVLLAVAVGLLLASRGRRGPPPAGAHSAPTAATVLPGAKAPQGDSGGASAMEPSDG